MDYNARVLAGKYAKAFYDISLFNISFEEYTQLQYFHQILCSNKAVIAMICMSMLDKATKQHYCTWLMQQYGLSNTLLGLIELLLMHERIALLPITLGCCLQLYEYHHQLERFEIISAVPLTDDDYTLIERFLSSKLKKKIIGKRLVDSINLIAGVKIKSVTHCLDYSLTKKLHSVRNMLLTQGITWK